MVLPSSDSREKSGANVDRVMRGVDNLPERRAMWRPTYSINATTKATTTSASGLCFMDPCPLTDDKFLSGNSCARYRAKRFRNENQFEIRVKRPRTSKTPSAINKPPLATSRACICERKRL